jgi:hypothetical protein
MADDLLLAQYPKQQTVRDRNFSALVIWSNAIAAQPIPPDKPPPDVVRQRIVAERIPIQTDIYVTRTMSYFMQDGTTQVNIRQFLSQWNDDATEVSLSAQLASVIAAFMPRFALTDISDADVEAWFTANGFV